MLKHPVRNMLRVVLPLLITLMSLSAVQAQGDASRALASGVPVSGTLDASSIAQIYTLEGVTGQIIDLEAASEDGLTLSMLLTDADGQPIAQGVEGDAVGTIAISGVILPLDGTYYVTIFPAPGSAAPVVGTFTLTLTAGDEPQAVAQAATFTPTPPVSLTSEATDEVDAPTTTTPAVTGQATGAATQATPTLPVTQTPQADAQSTLSVTPQTTPGLTPTGATDGTTGFTPPGLLLTTTGLQVSLSWNSTANMDLEIRDPVGGSLFWDTPSVPSGGTFGVNVNGACDTATAETPTEQASWAAGAVPTGSYELLVYYQELTDCPAGVPVPFTVSAVVDGRQLPPIQGTLQPNQIFVTSFVVNADGTAAPGVSGIYSVGALTFPVTDLTVNQTPVTVGTTISSFITSAQPFQTFSFNAEANDLVTVNMNATSGSLDPQVYLLDPNGSILAFNDDQAEGNTNSAIVDQRLLTTGTYTIVATRYGQTIGGTEGDFDLTLAGPSGNLPQEVVALQLPQGVIELTLVWNTGADLQLLVRDPRGDAVFDDIPQIPSGGRLASSGNVNCQPAATAPVSYIYWPEGVVPPAGAYEVEIQYQNACNDTRLVTFNLFMEVNGQLVSQQTFQPTVDQRYVTSFVIDANGVVTAGEGGLMGTLQRPEAQSLNYQAQIPNAVPVQDGDSISSTITLDKKFDAYSFEGQAGDVITVNMTATGGTLDTTLYLIDPNGVQVAENDDANRDTTDSLISEFTLPEAGQYIIIASHFGAQYGVTTGTYTLTFSRLN
jgi:hypothetical protein